MTLSPILVLDNGGQSIKAGLSSQDASQVTVLSNAVVRSKTSKKTYIGHEFNNCTEFTSLNWRVPFEKGYLTDWDVQKAVWDGLFDKLKVEPENSRLLITEPPFDFATLQDKYDQLVFEEYEFESYFRTCPAALTPYGTLFHPPNIVSFSSTSSPSSSPPPSPSSSHSHSHSQTQLHHPPQCTLLLDTGFSFTHTIPLINGVPIWSAVRRIDVGGKLLTNYLAQLVSYRQWNVMDEWWVVEGVKKGVGFVAPHRGISGIGGGKGFSALLEECKASPRKNSILREYILPDYTRNKPGRVRNPSLQKQRQKNGEEDEEMITENDQVLYMENERFAVPELLFNPSDIGMRQAGIAETIARSISVLPLDLQNMFWANIGLIGGNVLFEGFERRLMTELRQLAPVDADVVLYRETDPILTAYKSAHAFSRTPYFAEIAVTKEEYKEYGSNACLRKWKGWEWREWGTAAAAAPTPATTAPTASISAAGLGLGRYKEPGWTYARKGVGIFAGGDGEYTWNFEGEGDLTFVDGGLGTPGTGLGTTGGAISAVGGGRRRTTGAGTGTGAGGEGVGEGKPLKGTKGTKGAGATARSSKLGTSLEKGKGKGRAGALKKAAAASSAGGGDTTSAPGTPAKTSRSAKATIIPQVRKPQGGGTKSRPSRA